MKAKHIKFIRDNLGCSMMEAKQLAQMLLNPLFWELFKPEESENIPKTKVGEYND